MMLVLAWLALGAVCNSEQAAVAERYLLTYPDDVETRTRLLVYYLYRHQDPKVRQARIGQIAWMVEHHPEMQFPDQRVWLVDGRDKAGFARVRELWLRQVKKFPDTPQVLANAGMVLSLSDRALAAGWLRKLPGKAWDLGMLYADAIVGVTARTPYYGTGPVDPAAAQPALIEEVRRSTDAVFVYHVGWHLGLTTESFTRDGRCAPNFNALAEEFLERSVKLAQMDFQAKAYREALDTFRRRAAVWKQRGLGPGNCPKPAFPPDPDGLVLNGICPAPTP